MHVFGLWEEARVPGGNPDKHGENMPTPHRKTTAGVGTRNLFAVKYQCSGNSGLQTHTERKKRGAVGFRRAQKTTGTVKCGHIYKMQGVDS